MKKKLLLFVATMLVLASCSKPTFTKDQALTVMPEDQVRGSSSAVLTLIEFSDFQCPACGSYYPLVKQLKTDFPNDLRVVYRHFPLTGIHKNAMTAAKASEAAARQGKFWEMHDKLFETQKSWSESITARDVFAGFATELGLNRDQFLKDMDSPEVQKRIQYGQDTGDALGVNATPTFYLNGNELQPPNSYEDFKKIMELAKEQSKFLTKPSGGNSNQNSKPEAYHSHADFKTYINGKAIDFSQEKYQSSETKHLNEYVHLHDGNGEVIHKHKADVTLGLFFTSLKMDLTKDCLTLDTGDKYCSDAKNTLKMYVNGQKNDQFGDYNMKDIDRILISYGSESEAQIKTQLDSVTDKACIYSEKCPERGKPPTESCVGGLGTGCKE